MSKESLLLILNKRPALTMGFFYLIGQGGYFLSQYWLKATGNDILLGEIILLIAMLSFALQFSEFGSNTYLSAAFRRGGNRDAVRFMCSRSVVGFIVLLASVLFFPNIGFGLEVYLIPLSALFFGFSRLGRFDAENDYARIALSQLVPWLIVIFYILVSVYFRIHYFYLIFSFLLFSIFYSDYAALKRLISIDFKKFDVFAAIPFVAPVLMGQIWARYKFGLVYLTGGHALLGDYGIVVGLQSGIFVLIIKIARPGIARYLHEIYKANSQFKCLEIVKHFYKTFVISLVLGLIGSVALWFLSWRLGRNYNDWIIVFFVIPFFLLQSIFSNFAAMHLGKFNIIAVEHAALGFNVALFVMLMDYDIPIAIFLAETSAAVLCIGCYAYYLNCGSCAKLKGGL